MYTQMELPFNDPGHLPGVEPAGCWNCLHAEITGKRPVEHKPGLEYHAACGAPDTHYNGIARIVMSEERTELPMCPSYVHSTK